MTGVPLPKDWKPDPEFQEKLKDYLDAGMPIGEAPDCANFPDRELAMSGWTKGRYPRVDCMTGEVLSEGEKSLVEKQREYAYKLQQSEREVG